MRVVLDTNIVISALLFKAALSPIHKQWKTGSIVPVANKAMLLEYAKVLSYKKFSLTEEEIAALFDEEIFPYFSVVPTSSKKIPHPPKDESDSPFLQAAVDGGVRYLISGDIHLLELSGKYPFAIVTPADFLKKG
ncbi:MAG: putative toxin-antitoxin system toxin component, PIN family [Chitinivibrionales bacterium]|nr:putative toxin-antitoxin system toxin component, PIN family [Chitinivibrionales bacterium]